MPPQGSQLHILAADANPALLDLPWSQPLDRWPEQIVAALPRGISRHVVRFVYLEGHILAVKEIGEDVAFHEYEALRELVRLGAPVVTPLAVVTGRQTANGERLNAALVTRHLPFSLPYRSLFGHRQRAETVTRLINALDVLMVRLHLLGFYWGDVSLSNTLFRRDAGSFAAYLVDAETGEMHPDLPEKLREYDMDVARTNIIGELMDLQAGEELAPEVDAVAIGDAFVARYRRLWEELTEKTEFQVDEKWKVTERIHRLNSLGFDVDEMSLSTGRDGTRVFIQPKVVEPGHYRRRIMRLTGIDVEENQARRMVNDMEQYRMDSGHPTMPESVSAHEWLTNVFEPTVNAIPRELRGKLQPAELFHEVLEHRWFISQHQHRDVPQREAVASFVDNVLRHRRDEVSFVGEAPRSLSENPGAVTGDTAY